MSRGFYTAGSGMLTQQKIMNTIGQNMTNSQTAGYKKGTLLTNTFDQELLIRLEKDKVDNLAADNKISGALISYPEKLIADYEQGGLDETNRAYDMALLGEGFFVVQRGEQQLLTRNGQFTIDDETYLCLPTGERVLNTSGEPIKLPNDTFRVDANGVITDGRSKKGTLMIVKPENYEMLSRTDEGFFVNDDINNENALVSVEGQTAVMQGFYERSNVDIGQEMTSIMSASRAFQSCSQVLKMIDQINIKSVTELGKI